MYFIFLMIFFVLLLSGLFLCKSINYIIGLAIKV